MVTIETEVEIVEIWKEGEIIETVETKATDKFGMAKMPVPICPEYLTDGNKEIEERLIVMPKSLLLSKKQIDKMIVDWTKIHPDIPFSIHAMVSEIIKGSKKEIGYG